MTTSCCNPLRGHMCFVFPIVSFTLKKWKHGIWSTGHFLGECDLNYILNPQYNHILRTVMSSSCDSKGRDALRLLSCCRQVQHAVKVSTPASSSLPRPVGLSSLEYLPNQELTCHSGRGRVTGRGEEGEWKAGKGHTKRGANTTPEKRDIQGDEEIVPMPRKEECKKYKLISLEISLP